MKLLDMLALYDAQEMEALRLDNNFSAKSRMASGVSKYGEFNPDSDSRDLFYEIECELYDTINYAHMELMRIKLMREKLKVQK